jgi:hypothetical protein
MGHGDIEAICQNNAEAIGTGYQSLDVSQDFENHVGKRDGLFHFGRTKNPFKSLKN